MLEGTLRNFDLDALAKEMADYAKLGTDTVIVSPPTAEPVPWIEDRAAPAAQWLAELG
jgi:hypothetical protein